MLNKIIVIGYLAGDPELKYTPDGKAVTNFRIGVSQTYRGAKQWKENTEWFTVVTWNKRAEAMNARLTKGARVLVEGRLESHQWSANGGEARFQNQIIASYVEFLDRGKSKSAEDAEPEPVDGAAGADLP